MPLFYSPLSFYWRTPGPILLLRLRYSNRRAIVSFRSLSRLPTASVTIFGPTNEGSPLGRFPLIAGRALVVLLTPERSFFGLRYSYLRRLSSVAFGVDCSRQPNDRPDEGVMGFVGAVFAQQ